ncbi:sure-like protein [Meira miltonrushii]|uniref:Sure-like protein n=1 Tax=Meira miltonrushii TaxID=1280837 RepID=A0A316V4F9_9BASI|nr:sure-like protein [Meira miltonrushii]PWN31898.1 sure-like protein [Meira miltonrushii]
MLGSQFIVRSIAFVLLLINLQYCSALKILIGNDDSWGTANIHALYNTAKAAGHDAIIAAPAMQQSGTDGLRHKPTRLAKNGAFNLVPAGAPAEGHDPKDDHVWYINSTPASSIEYGLNELCPRYFKSDPDLVITGTNQGNNLGLSYLGSGTYGAAKFAVTSKDIPAIAFSAGDSAEREYTELGGPNDQANIYAAMAFDLINQLIVNKDKGAEAAGRLLPSRTLLNVNFPDQTKFNCQSSQSKWVLTRILGTLDPSPDTCTCGEKKLCKLPTESSVFRDSSHGCTNSISVSVPNLNPDASADQQKAVDEKLHNLLSCLS